MLTPTIIDIEGRKYTVIPFNPIDAFRFFHESLNVTMRVGNREDIGLKALRQCTNDKGRSLADEDVFQETFSLHPRDMLELEKRAREALLGPFLSQSNDMMQTESD